MGVFKRGNKLWITFKDVDGEWRNRAAGYNVGQETLAQALYDEVVKQVAKQSVMVRAGDASSGASVLVPSAATVASYAEAWLEERRKLDLDYKNDRSRLQHHVLPRIGPMKIADVRARHLIEMFREIRTTISEFTGELLAPRMIYNIYSVVSAMFRDAKLADLLTQSPCELDARHLGPLVDKDPEWREGEVYDRPEARLLVTDERIAWDRRVYYALMVLAGMRPGEIAVVRWRNYDATFEPLGKITVAHGHNTRKGTTKGTKTGAVRHEPVHPTLAAILAEWKLGGWAEMVGRAPEPDDLIVPLPPADADARRSREGEPIRTGDYAGKKWREVDLPALGWRPRTMYAMKSTFISLCIEDGADPDVIEHQVTHTKKKRGAFHGYDRGPKWIGACREVAKLQLTRETGEQQIAATATGDPPDSAPYSATTEEDRKGKSWRRRESNRPAADIQERSGTSSPTLSVVPNVAIVSDATAGVSRALQDPIVAALESASAAWSEDGDPARLRRALLRLLADLE